MRMSVPSYNVGPAISLGGFGAGFSADGSYYVDDVGGVYAMGPDGNWQLDPHATTAVQQVVDAGGSGAVTQAANTQSTYSGFLTAIQQALPAFIQYKASNDILQTNLELAKMGKPPLTSAQITPGVSVGLTSNTQTFIGVAIAAVLGVWFLSATQRR